MEKGNIEKEMVQEMMKLLEKTGFGTFPLVTGTADNVSALEAALINLKSLNARYDKSDAITHVKALVEKYNIQLDELLEGSRR